MRCNFRFRFILLLSPRKRKLVSTDCTRAVVHIIHTYFHQIQVYRVREHDTHILHQICISSPTCILPKGGSTNKTISLLNDTLPSFCEFNILIAEGTKLFPKHAFLGGTCFYLRPNGRRVKHEFRRWLGLLIIVFALRMMAVSIISHKLRVERPFIFEEVLVIL